MRPAKRWIVMPASGSPTMGARTMPQLLVQLLANRGLTTPNEIDAFLHPKFNDLPTPELLPGCIAAAERILAAVRAGRKIVVYGDYDVDGTTGAAILWHAIRLAGGNVDFYVPHRLEEGYGLNVEALASIAAGGATMVVTVDCGIASVEEAQAARTLGLELIVTDHHEPGASLPAAAAIVHPRLSADGGQCHYPNPHLCGAGVAMKLAWAIGQHLSNSVKVSDQFRDFLVQATSLAALGTVADVVPLLGENRVIVTFGLLGIKQTGLPGLDALIDSAGLRSERVDAYHVGFTLAPRLNAAGRMDEANKVVELFTAADAARGREIADYLERQNRNRQATERAILHEAIAKLDADPKFAQRRSIVLADPGWHPGVVGIVASRLVERYNRPTVLVGMQNGTGQGSARSIQPGPDFSFSINDALAACKDCLVSFGGHAMAGGLRVKAEQFDAFAESFERFACSRLKPEDLAPRLRIDADVTADDLRFDVVSQVLKLAPFGQGNPKPVLAARGCSLANPPRRVGTDGGHLQFHVRLPSVRAPAGGQVFQAIAFNGAHWERPLAAGRPFDLAFEPDINTYNQRSSVQLCVRDIRWDQQ